MSRSPLFYPLNRGMDADAGGVAELQTDVMRFIAILALCLVAIFALVQSIPLLPLPVDPAPQAPKGNVPAAVDSQPVTGPARIPDIAEPASSSPTQQPIVVTRPAARRIPSREVSPLVIEQLAAPVETTGDAIPEPPAAAQSAEAGGFTLRFETDLALTRLVARNEVGLYAITPEESLRMNVNRGALSFWAASVPNEFHEMDKTTVPQDVLIALRRAGGVSAAEVRWGVTLPAEMRRQLDRFLSESDGGSLIIGGDGTLRLEP